MAKPCWRRYPRHYIKVVHGGLQVLNEKGDDGVLIANAIVIVSIDDVTKPLCSNP
jgi:hypothetical protein